MPRDLNLATAQTELAEARTALDTLTERVREGDQDVTPEQLATQRELISFAELRVEAAQRTEIRIREEERAALAAAAKQAAEQLIAGSGMDEIAAAERAAVDAIAHLAALAHARNARIAEIGTTIVNLEDAMEVAGHGKAPGNMRHYGVWGGRDRLVVLNVGRVSALDVGALTTAAVVAGLGVDPVGRDAQKRHMNAFHGLRDQVVHNLLEAYPQLAEVLRVSAEQFAAADTKGRYDLVAQGRRPLPEAVEG